MRQNIVQYNFLAAALSFRQSGSHFVAALAAIAIPIIVFGWPDMFWPTIILLGLLIYLAIVDCNQLRLPDVGTLSLAVVGSWTIWQHWPSLLAQHFSTALIIGTFLWLLSTIWWRVRGIEVLGLGDVKFAFAATIWVGPAMIYVILCAAGSALVLAITNVILGRRSASDPIPFGPFLCGALWAVWLWFS